MYLSMLQGCKITIGGVSFSGATEVKITHSVNDANATAVVKVPVTAVLKQRGGEKTSIETAKAINVGDAVAIRLGYDGKLKDEFVGFVKRLNYTVPLEIECEDWYWKLRQVTLSKSYAETTVKGLLSDILGGTGATVHPDTIDLTLTNTIVDNKTGAWIVDKLKSDYGLTCYFDLRGRLYCGKSNAAPTDTIKYELRNNTIKDDDLKYYKADDFKIEVEAITYDRNGSKITATAGTSGGEKKTVHFYDVTDSTQLKALAQEEVKRQSFDGYRGKLETFLVPYAQPGMGADVTDTTYDERSGTYHINSVEVTWSTSGARRIVELGTKV